jgi:hypothetical protein
VANKDMPCGFVPYGKISKIAIHEAGSAIYPGDFVALASDGQIDAATATNDILGLALDYASAAGQKVRVSVDPEQLYVGQVDDNGIAAQTDVGQTVEILATAGSSTYKASRMEIDGSEKGSSKALLIVGLAPDNNNAFGTNARVIVKIAKHQAYGTDDFAGV